MSSPRRLDAEPAAEGHASARGQDTVRRLTWLLVGVMGVSGLALRVALRDAGSLWLDELWTLDAVSRSYQEMVGARLVSDQAPPVWTSLAWVWLRAVGTYDATAVRTLPLVLSVVSVAVPAVGAWRMRVLRPPLLVMAALMALSLLVVQYAVEFRNYSFTLALGTVASVIWAGLLTDQLSQSGRWIFTFALSGSLAGFAHYYGNLLYASELGVLALVWLARRQHRGLRPLIVWGALSLVPVTTWFFVTRRWSPGIAVAAEPSIGELSRWTQDSFAPLTDLLAGQPPGYPEGSSPAGVLVLGGALVALAVAWVRVRRAAVTGDEAAIVVLGAAAAGVVGLGVALAWTVSVLLPPSMNTRNLSALVPALFLIVACATTAARRPSGRWTAALGAVALWGAAAAAYVATYGVNSLGPPWQESAGYRRTAQLLVQSQEATEPPTLVGLQQPWLWHGDWDAALRAEMGRGPAAPSDPEPLPVTWVVGPDDPLLGRVPDSSLVVFGYADDPRTRPLLDWAEDTHGPCHETTAGELGFGNVTLASCEPSG